MGPIGRRDLPKVQLVDIMEKLGLFFKKHQAKKPLLSF